MTDPSYASRFDDVTRFSYIPCGLEKLSLQIQIDFN